MDMSSPLATRLDRYFRFLTTSPAISFADLLKGCLDLLQASQQTVQKSALLVYLQEVRHCHFQGFSRNEALKSLRDLLAAIQKGKTPTLHRSSWTDNRSSFQERSIQSFTDSLQMFTPLPDSSPLLKSCSGFAPIFFIQYLTH